MQGYHRSVQKTDLFRTAILANAEALKMALTGRRFLEGFFEHRFSAKSLGLERPETVAALIRIDGGSEVRTHVGLEARIFNFGDMALRDASHLGKPHLRHVLLTPKAISLPL